MRGAEPPVLLGCGILEREIRLLMEKNGWGVDLDALESSLHVDLEALATALQAGFRRNAGRRVHVFYGCCHPLMDRMLAEAGAVGRMPGQNCVEMLLGPERFREELSAGAFFLLEDWVRGWDRATGATFGDNPKVAREIFQLSCNYLLCLHTPCSGDYAADAAAIGEKTGLPLRWLDVPLDHLEAGLREMLEPAPGISTEPR